MKVSKAETGFAALLAITAAGVGGLRCGNSVRNLCSEYRVTCGEALSCDPFDGLCKCGGPGGLVCGGGFTCDSVGKTCVSNRCARVDCSDQPGTSCDLLTGTCKCGGTAGRSCGEAEICNPIARACVARTTCSLVVCPRNQTCEPATGACGCGGEPCGAGHSCGEGDGGSKVCLPDTCAGVSCTGNTQCDPLDGFCKCAGVVCQSGETCACPAGADGGACQASARACRAGTACAGVACASGSALTCDPTDGLCKCGGPGGQVCVGAQLCALLPSLQCQGGDQCALPDGGPRVCPGGTSCDPEDGRCKCGGRGGIACPGAAAGDGGSSPAEVCVLHFQQKACRRPCDVRNPGGCPAGTFCYFDGTSLTPVAYCAPNTEAREEDWSCTSATACFSSTPTAHALHCSGLSLVTGQTGSCRPYCDLASGVSGCLQVPVAQECMQLSGAPAGYGFCRRR